MGKRQERNGRNQIKSNTPHPLQTPQRMGHPQNPMPRPEQGKPESKKSQRHPQNPIPRPEQGKPQRKKSQNDGDGDGDGNGNGNGNGEENSGSLTRPRLGSG